MEWSPLYLSIHLRTKFYQSKRSSSSMAVERWYSRQPASHRHPLLIQTNPRGMWSGFRDATTMEARKTQEIVTTFSAFRGRWLRRVRQVLHNRHTYVQKETRQAIAEHTATAAAAEGTTHLSIDRSLAWFDYLHTTYLSPTLHSLPTGHLWSSRRSPSSSSSRWGQQSKGSDWAIVRLDRTNRKWQLGDNKRSGIMFAQNYLFH